MITIVLIVVESGLMIAVAFGMMAKNTDNVDAVSGATISSKTIRNAVNCALQKGTQT